MPLAGVRVCGAVAAFGVDRVGPPALPLVGVGVCGAVAAFGADCGGPSALPLVGVGVRGAVEAFVAVAARPVAGGTGVFSCEEETCRKYSHGMLSF